MRSYAKVMVLPYEKAARLAADGIDEEEDLVEVSCLRLDFHPSMLEAYFEYRRTNLFLS